MQLQISDPSLRDPSLRITEIFYSIQGETTFSGLPTVFIRLSGCPLRCSYCDTAYAFHGGEKLTFSHIIKQVESFGCHQITVTGGEPLAQENCPALLQQLADLGYCISLETSGVLSIEKVPPPIHIILDLKTPSSNESQRNDWNNINLIKPSDQIKFVIGNRQDYEWSIAKIMQYNLTEKVAELLFSPIHGSLPAAELAEWILADKLNVRLQLQLHKYLWNDESGR